MSTHPMKLVTIVCEAHARDAVTKLLRDVGAHVTFIAATPYLKAINQPFESYATAFLAVMESPAILAGVVLGKLATKKAGGDSAERQATK